MINLSAPLCAVVCAPLLPGIINRTKAYMAGRKGAPLLQLYYDLFKLFKKGTVYSRTTGWPFRAAPLVGLACALSTLLLIPLGPAAAAITFRGDIILTCYLLGLLRFATVLAALDTGSSFEGLGAAREMFFAALAEPALLMALAAMTKGSLSLSGLAQASLLEPSVILAMAALFLVLLTENARLPVDDPTTHLELTMIHEVMILDHSGPDLGLLEYSSSLKLWISMALMAAIIMPAGPLSLLTTPLFFLALAVTIGLLESSMARLRISRIPQLMVAAGVLAALALLLQ